MKPNLLAFLPLILLVVLGIAFGIGLTKDPTKLNSALIDRPMPEFLLQPVFPDAPVFARSDLIGQVSLVNVFGSWCVACLHEHPFLMYLSRQQNQVIFGINWREKAEDGAAWLRKHGDPYQKVGLDADSRLALDLGVTGAPETYLIDKQGHIRFKHVGPITRQVWQETLQPLVQMLEQEP